MVASRKAANTAFIESNEVSNATGCSSIYGGSAPATPYCRWYACEHRFIQSNTVSNYRSGFGPAWANSLFEDNAEFGLGMATVKELPVAVPIAKRRIDRQMRDRVERIMKEGLGCDCCSAEIKALFTEWIECYGCEHRLNQSNEVSNRENTLKTKEIADKLIPLMEACGCDICKQLLELRHSLVKKSQWIFGGDGWGYDIGFGGLDHVLASGEDVCRRLRTPLNKDIEVSNVVVVDTEVYSNTGGQSSKATPAGAVAKLPPQGRQPQHATSGKKIRKKDLGMIAKSYGYVYVAQVAMGASQAQYFCRMTQEPVARVEKTCAVATPLNNSNEVSNVIKEAFILRSLRSLSKVHWTFFTYHGPSLSLRLNPRNGDFSGLGSQVHWTCSYATPLQSAVRPRTPLKSKSNEVSCRRP